MSDLRRTVLKLHQELIDADINIDRTVEVPASQLEDGVQRTDVYLDMHVGKDKQKAYKRVSAVLDKAFEQDGSGNYWNGETSKDDEDVTVGIDVDDDGQMYVGVEAHAQEFYDKQMGEGKMSSKQSFKQFFTEARKAGVNFQEEKTKGAVVKVIALLEGHEAGKLTRAARQYHSILKALKKLGEKKDELNAQLKDMVGDTFDPELDKYLTRVLASTAFTATLAKETNPVEVEDKVTVQYDLLAEGLLKLLTDDLKPAGEALLEACTKRWTPEPKSPNLTVKKLDEGMVDTFRKWWRDLKDVMMKALLRFDKNLAQLEAQLTAYKRLPKPKVAPKQPN